MERCNTLKDTIMDTQTMSAAQTVSAKQFSERKGARAVKTIERLESTSHALNPEEATI